MSTVSKNIIFMILVIFIIVGIELSIAHSLMKKTESVIESTQVLITQIEQEEYISANGQLAFLKNMWKVYSSSLSLHLDHSVIDNIGAEIDLMENLFNTEEYSDTIVRSKLLISKIENLRGYEKLLIKNVF